MDPSGEAPVAGMGGMAGDLTQGKGERIHKTLKCWLLAHLVAVSIAMLKALSQCVLRHLIWGYRRGLYGW